MLDVLYPEHADRNHAELFIHGVFAREYAADVRHFMPHLLRLRHDDTGMCYSIAGCRDAASGKLFVERYLEAPIESVLSQQMGYDLPRASIVEVGNLAEAKSGASRIAMFAMLSFLFGAGYEWGIMTAVPKVANAFHRMGLTSAEIGIADASKLSLHEQKEWGTYYDKQPKLRVANLRKNFRILETFSFTFAPEQHDVMDKARRLGLGWRRILDEKAEEGIS